MDVQQREIQNLIVNYSKGMGNVSILDNSVDEPVSPVCPTTARYWVARSFIFFLIIGLTCIAVFAATNPIHPSEKTFSSSVDSPNEPGSLPPANLTIVKNIRLTVTVDTQSEYNTSFLSISERCMRVNLIINLTNPNDWQPGFKMRNVEKVLGLSLEGPFFLEAMIEIFNQTGNATSIKLINNNDLICDRKRPLSINPGTVILNNVTSFTFQAPSECVVVLEMLVKWCVMPKLKHVEFQNATLTTENVDLINQLLVNAKDSLESITFPAVKLMTGGLFQVPVVFKRVKIIEVSVGSCIEGFKFKDEFLRLDNFSTKFPNVEKLAINHPVEVDECK